MGTDAILANSPSLTYKKAASEVCPVCDWTESGVPEVFRSGNHSTFWGPLFRRGVFRKTREIPSHSP